MKKQIIYIHGGNAFDSYEVYLEHLKKTPLDPNYNKKKKWKNTLETHLGDDFEVFTPTMPNKQNAHYVEWKIWFEKLLPYIHDKVVIIGHSLGGLFIAKYLSENVFPKKIQTVYLVAAPFDACGTEYAQNDFVLPHDLHLFEKNAHTIFLYHSEDDSVVSFKNIEKYADNLPHAQKLIFKDKDHFNQEEFPELVKSIKQLY